MRQKNALAAPGLILGCVLFALGSLIVKIVPIGSYAIAFWRMAIGFCIFTALIFICKQHLPKSRKAVYYALLSGIFLAFDLAFWHESIHAIGPGISTLLNGLQIFFLTAIGFFFFQERPHLTQLFSLVIAIIGVAFIAGNEFQHNGQATWGFIMGLVSGVMVAAAMASIRKVQLIEATPLIPLMALVNFSGAIVLIPFALFDAHGFIPHGTENLILIAIYGIVMQCVAWTLIAFAIPYLTFALTGLLMLSEPVAALFIDAAILQKPINLLQWFGAALTLFAIYLGTLKRRT